MRYEGYGEEVKDGVEAGGGNMVKDGLEWGLWWRTYKGWELIGILRIV